MNPGTLDHGYREDGTDTAEPYCCARMTEHGQGEERRRKLWLGDTSHGKHQYLRFLSVFHGQYKVQVGLVVLWYRAVVVCTMW